MTEQKKGVRTQHPEYTAALDKWKRCEDANEGQDAVHDAGTLYLPKLKDQTPDDYAAYKGRATFYNATRRTVVGLMGMLFRKPSQIEAPENIKAMFDDVTLGGTPLQIFAQEIVEDNLVVGRVGILVDHPRTNSDGRPITLAAAQQMGLRPSLAKYNASAIINWKTTRINNREVLSLVVLKESAGVPVDEFGEQQEVRYRVLDLVPIENRVAYRVRVFSIDEKDQDVLREEFFPLKKGAPLDAIPFFFINVDDLTTAVDDPPLIDLVNVNLSHYRGTADYEHGCHFTGLPTPVVSGYTPETKGEKFYIGSTTAWVFPDPNAKASYLEFTGQGLATLEKNLERKESQMAILGARMLEVQKRAAEASETAAIHRTGENSILSGIAQSISLGLTKALQTFADWAGAGSIVSYELNRDFLPTPMDAQTLTALVAGWQNGAYSYDTLFENLQRGEIIAADNTAESEQAKKNNEPPTLMGGLPGSGDL